MSKSVTHWLRHVPSGNRTAVCNGLVPKEGCGTQYLPDLTCKRCLNKLCKMAYDDMVAAEEQAHRHRTSYKNFDRRRKEVEAGPYV